MKHLHLVAAVAGLAVAVGWPLSLAGRRPCWTTQARPTRRFRRPDEAPACRNDPLGR